ncbi:hypothetical protein [Microlunatus speluncae]|uniref:hypothetical protein n=1 Tax=Microlunatus speluncae TaxID=2594267 RepID=UPI001266733C|nr:hypothetical protein [Microlunatus speluncae]
MTDANEILAAVVAAAAPGARIASVAPYRCAPLPFPAKLTLDTDDGPVDWVVKVVADPVPLQLESATLRALAELGAMGFAIPRVLAGPIPTTAAAGSLHALVLSVAPGRVLPWIGVAEVASADRTCRLLFDAIDRLHRLTPRVAAHPFAADLPERTLDDELAAAARRVSPWTGTRVMSEALAVLHEVVPRHRRPLVFSNGDYNPLNVLADETGLISWVDFELACFEDPLIGLPKFQFWADDGGWSLGSKDSPVDSPPTRMITQIERATRLLRRDDHR